MRSPSKLAMHLQEWGSFKNCHKNQRYKEDNKKQFKKTQLTVTTANIIWSCFIFTFVNCCNLFECLRWATIVYDAIINCIIMKHIRKSKLKKEQEKERSVDYNGNCTQRSLAAVLIAVAPPPWMGARCFCLLVNCPTVGLIEGKLTPYVSTHNQK